MGYCSMLLTKASSSGLPILKNSAKLTMQINFEVILEGIKLERNQLLVYVYTPTYMIVDILICVQLYSYSYMYTPIQG